MIKFDNLQAALEEYGNVIAEQYKSNLKANGHKATGNLINSITSHITVNGYEYAIELTLEKYYKYIEEGTGAAHSPDPHSNYWPKVNAILNWIRIKPILPKPMANGKLPTEKQLVFLIGRAIAGESPNQSMLKSPNGGVKGSGDLEKAIDTTINEWDEKITDALDKDIMNCIDEILLMA